MVGLTVGCRGSSAPIVLMLASHREVSQPTHKLSAPSPVDEHQLLILFLSEAPHLAHNGATPTEHPLQDDCPHREVELQSWKMWESQKKYIYIFSGSTALWQHIQLKTVTTVRDAAGKLQFLSLMMQTAFSVGAQWWLQRTVWTNVTRGLERIWNSHWTLDLGVFMSYDDCQCFTEIEFFF